MKGPKHQVSEGKTPGITPEQARKVLSYIDTSHVVGLRDRAVIAAMIYTAARAGAVAKLRLRDFYTGVTVQRKRTRVGSTSERP